MLITIEDKVKGRFVKGWARGLYPKKDALVMLNSMGNNYRHRFDFDIGYLVKSPCRECADRYLFPECMDNCLPLDKIRTALANGVSCSRSFSSVESHAIYQGAKEE